MTIGQFMTKAFILLWFAGCCFVTGLFVQAWVVEGPPPTLEAGVLAHIALAVIWVALFVIRKIANEKTA